jgi:hypothetical protein
MDYIKLKEEPLKSAIQQDYFKSYKYTQLGNIDFVIAKHLTDKGVVSLFEEDDNIDLKSILWAEAKQGNTHDIYESFVQLILTIGKEKTFEKYLPPKYIGAFDAEKMAFIEYHNIQDVFYQNDFNWNVTPSNHETKEFKQLYDLCERILRENSILFKYENQADDLKIFIKQNFKTDKDVSEKIAVTKNNFTFVFQKWLELVKPTIDVNWQNANKAGIISADFFLADLLSSENESLKDLLYVVLKKTKYELAKKVNELGFETASYAKFTDNQKAYKEFWSVYERPPKEEYWEYIISRRDLLVPQDIRERKGSYFTPKIWVEKSQQYLTTVLGENWQDEYYIWDNCAGTGNLLNGLSNKRNIWASTIDKADVDIMKDMIHNGFNLFEDHVFQFDFLNDDFIPQSKGGKMPDDLCKIIFDEEERKKLVIYINPPYAEADNRKGEGRSGVAENKIHDKYADRLKKAQRELFALFFTRIYHEIPDCIIGEFSTLKHIQAANFKDFRQDFRATIKKSFIVPGDTFDNVKGQFPIGFFIWDLKEKKIFEDTIADVFDENGIMLGKKEMISYDNSILLNKWIDEYRPAKNVKDSIATMIGVASDFQNQRLTRIEVPYMKVPADNHNWQIISTNLIPSAIYLAVRWCMDSTWLNDRDQFLYPNENWSNDSIFKSDCLIYTLFHPQNHISYLASINHWIPFTEDQVGCKKAFKSNFMSKFLKGEIEIQNQDDLFSGEGKQKTEKIVLSQEAQSVYNAGLELWKYYHSQQKANPDASLYDIRKFFQGESKGRMNSSSNDETYMELIFNLRVSMKILAKRIEPKVYEYGFLK